MCTDRRPAVRHQAGITLIELILFVVIVSAALAGVLSVFNVTVMHSADPMVRKQLIAVAEALMEEVTLQPFTYCDPDDANVLTANDATVSATGCAGGTAAETRYADPRFDQISDYNSFVMNAATVCTGTDKGICDVNGHAIAALAGYGARVDVTNVGADFTLAADAVARVDVTVSRGGDSVILTSYRFRYAPNSP